MAILLLWSVLSFAGQQRSESLAEGAARAWILFLSVERFEVPPTAGGLVFNSSSRVPVVVDAEEAASNLVRVKPHGNTIRGGGGGEELFSGLDDVVALRQTRSVRRWLRHPAALDSSFIRGRRRGKQDKTVVAKKHTVQWWSNTLGCGWKAEQPSSEHRLVQHRPIVAAFLASFALAFIQSCGEERPQE
jgi:hypothetical protein